MSEACVLLLTDMSPLSVPEVPTVSPVQEDVPHRAHQQGWSSFIVAL